MRYAHILAAIRSTPWAAMPSTIQAVSDLLSARLRLVGAHLPAGVAPMHVPSRSRADGMPGQPEQDPEDGDGCGASSEGSDSAEPLYEIAAPGVALIEVRGIIGKHLSGMDTECGGCDIEQVARALDVAALDLGVRSIVLHFDTPGGTVPGVPELAARIRQIATAKPVYAFTDSLCASAGYWLASACSGIFATPSAQLGSIGVYMALVDQSAAFTEAGLRLVLVKAGEWKAAGEPGSEITPEQVALWQSTVDSLYAMFTADVRAGRPGVADETMQGQCFLGAAAVQAALADELVSGLDEVLSALAVAIPAAPAAPATT